jgi:hypothetical protein
MGANKTFQQKGIEDACSSSPTSSSVCGAIQFAALALLEASAG